MKEVRNILLEAADSSQLVRELYRLRKASDRRVSLAWLCRRAKIASKGNLGDVVRGMRRLHPKYASALGKAFDLVGLEAQYFRLMVELDHVTEIETATRLRRKLKRVRKALGFNRQPIPEGMENAFFAIEVFCAFGLFRNRPTRDDLVTYFGEGRRPWVEQALRQLVRWKLVAERGESLELLQEKIVFEKRERSFSHLDYLRLALRDAEKHVPRYFGKPEDSYLESMTISVNRESYRKFLPELHAAFRRMHARLESGRADTLIRFNVQVYPLNRE